MAHGIIELANLLCHRAKVVYFLGILKRNENRVRSKQVNDFLKAVSKNLRTPIKYQRRNPVQKLQSGAKQAW